MKKWIAGIFCFVVFCFLFGYLDNVSAAQVDPEIRNIINGQTKKMSNLVYKGIELKDKGKYDEAIQKFLRAKEVANIPLCSYYLGISYYKKADKKRAIEYFDETIRLHRLQYSESDKIFLELSYLHKMSIANDDGAYDEALKNCEQAIRYAGKDSKRVLEEMKISIRQLTKIKK